MSVELLSQFLMWCTVINGALLLLWTLMAIAMPDALYRMQTKWFDITREQHNLAMYCYLGFFKVFFLVFNLVPFVALKLMG